MAAGTTSGEATMDRRLLAAAASGDAASMKQLALDPGVLIREPVASMLSMLPSEMATQV